MLKRWIPTHPPFRRFRWHLLAGNSHSLVIYYVDQFHIQYIYILYTYGEHFIPCWIVLFWKTWRCTMEGGFSNLIGLLTQALVRSGIYIFFHFLEVTFVLLRLPLMTLKLPHLQVDDEEELEDAVTGLCTFICSFLVFPGFLGQIPEMISPHMPDAAIIPLHGLQSEPKVPNASKTTRLVALCRTIQYIAAGCRRFCLIGQALYKSIYIYISWESKINSRKTANTTIKHTLTKR